MTSPYQSAAFLTSTINQLTLENLNSFEVPIPPINEQTQISNFLDQKIIKIDALIGKIREAIDRLKEYRNALISAAVTGKVDVRIVGAQHVGARHAVPLQES